MSAAMIADAGPEMDGDLLWAWAARQYFPEIYTAAVDRRHARRLLLVRLATTISAWETEFLAYFDHRHIN